MEKNKVIDIHTRKAIFTDCVRMKLEEGVQPYLTEGQNGPAVVNTVEQILCTALVSAGVAIAVKLGSKLANKFTSRK